MLLIDTSVQSFIMIAITSFIGMFAVAAAIEGYLFGPMNPVFRVIIAASGLALMYPGTLTDLIGIGGVAAIFIIEWINRGKKKAATGLSFHGMKMKRVSSLNLQIHSRSWHLKSFSIQKLHLAT